MPDSVVWTAGANATPPAGTNVKTDTVGGQEIQFVKLDIGGDGLSNPVVDSLPVYNVSGTSVSVSVGDVIITGSIQVSNFPSIQGVSGTVSVSNFPYQQGISGSVSINKVALTPSAPTGTSVGLTSALVVSSSPNRTGLTFVNVSNSWVSFGLGTLAILYSGITLSPNGSSFVMDDYTYCTSEIYAIASVTGTILAIQEFV